MKFSIIINTHNQDDYLVRAITSCLKQDFKDYEIIICDTSDKKNNTKLKKLIIPKRVQYFHYKSKYSQPEQNQIDKILFGFKKSKGDFICLMDGDDFFNKKKLSFLKKIIDKKKFLFSQDNPSIVKNGLVVMRKIANKTYKNNYLFNLLLNDWPQIYGTSSIVVEKKVLKKFFKKAKPFNWRYLAIDAQLALFCKVHFSIKGDLENLTKKTIHNRNLGDQYLNLSSKKFWIRRFMQHKYYAFLRKKNKFSLDFFLTIILFYLFRKL
tara:strand:+ start:228 stop:1025 length:798 start_codon:yes stop_codon:yes gene_type:complete